MGNGVVTATAISKVPHPTALLVVYVVLLAFWLFCLMFVPYGKRGKRSEEVENQGEE